MGTLNELLETLLAILWAIIALVLLSFSDKIFVIYVATSFILLIYIHTRKPKKNEEEEI